MLRAFNPTLDGPADADEAWRYRYVNGERVCGWSCDPSGPYYEQDKHLCPKACRSDRFAGGSSLPSRSEIGGVCSEPPPPLPPRSSGAASCSSGEAAITAAGVWMLIGVQTGPAHLPRRDGVRASWKRFEAETDGVLVCFLVGRGGLGPSALAALEAEEAEHGDILWLPNATDAGVPTIKGYHWWRAAAALLPREGSASGLRIAAKVDDDSFVHLGNLVRDMRQLHCVRHLHYGSIGFTGYDPSSWRLCGWSWQPRGNNYRKERCARKGAHPPFPFMNGALELLSAPLVRYVAHSPEVAGFVSRAQQAVDARLAAGWPVFDPRRGKAKGPRVWRQNEDVALGFWISRGERRGLFNVTWVRINDRAINMACISTKGMYQRPRNDTISVHFLKRPGGSLYLWGLMHDGVPHSAENCTRWVWHDNCRGKDASSHWCQQYKTADLNFDDAPVRAEDRKARGLARGQPDDL